MIVQLQLRSYSCRSSYNWLPVACSRPPRRQRVAQQPFKTASLAAAAAATACYNLPAMGSHGLKAALAGKLPALPDFKLPDFDIERLTSLLTSLQLDLGGTPKELVVGSLAAAVCVTVVCVSRTTAADRQPAAMQDRDNMNINNLESRIAALEVQCARLVTRSNSTNASPGAIIAGIEKGMRAHDLRVQEVEATCASLAQSMEQMRKQDATARKHMGQHKKRVPGEELFQATTTDVDGCRDELAASSAQMRGGEQLTVPEAQAVMQGAGADGAGAIDRSEFAELVMPAPQARDGEDSGGLGDLTSIAPAPESPPMTPWPSVAPGATPAMTRRTLSTIPRHARASSSPCSEGCGAMAGSPLSPLSSQTPAIDVVVTRAALASASENRNASAIGNGNGNESGHSPLVQSARALVDAHCTRLLGLQEQLDKHHEKVEQLHESIHNIELN